jgi:SOS-response transcriptional repressor LexA
MRDNPIRAEILKFVAEYKREHGGNSPSIREIVAGTSSKSTSHVRYYLLQLQNEGVLIVHGRRQIEFGEWSFV